MIDIKWITIGTVLALGMVLTSCTGGGREATVPQDQEVTISKPVQAPEENPRPIQELVSPTPAGQEPAAQGSPEVDVFSAPPTSSSSEAPEPEPVVGLIPEGEAVEEDWFADAVFLGDSRTDGLKLYSGLKMGTFFSYKGLSVFSIDDKPCIPLEGETVTVLEALSRSRFAKVYILLGINELGYPNTEAFKTAYATLVMSIQEIQPEATIYLQLQPPVNEALAASKGMSQSINNERILLFNELITQVAEEQGTALVNVWEALAEPDGSLSADLTSDGIHMKRAGYERWYGYLRTHTGTVPVVEFETGGTPADVSSSTEGNQRPSAHMLFDKGTG